MLETRQIAQPKELNITNINREKVKRHRKIGLPLNCYFCNCESNLRFAAAISFECVLIPPPSQILTIVCGNIFCL